MTSTIAITGATGFVGSALRNRLEQRGDHVVAITRTPKRDDDIAWDLAAGTLDRDKLAGVDAVVNLAGASIGRWPWTASYKQAIRSSRIGGTALIADTLNAMDDPPKTLVSTSAVGIYGDRGDEVLDETSAPGNGFLAQVCRDWEAAADTVSRSRVVHPRFGLVFGASGGMLPLIAKPFRFGIGGNLGSGAQYMSWIALDDLVDILVLAIDDDTLRGPVNAVSPGTLTNREFTRAMGRALRRPTVLPVPAPLLRLLGGDMARELLLTSQRVVPAVLTSRGFTFRYPTLDTALADMV